MAPHRPGGLAGAFIDQSQSLNLFSENPTIGKLSSMYLYAWKRGLKTTYYLRSRPATAIAKTTVPVAGRRGGRVLAREPRDLRGLPMNATTACSRPRFRTHLAAHALPALLRHVPRRHRTPGPSRRSISRSIQDLRERLTPAERHLIERLVAFFATGDTIVSNNLVLNLYKHVNAPEARMYLSRQLFEEALHIQFYLTLLDTYVPDRARRAQAFAAVENIPSIKPKRGSASNGSIDLRARSHRDRGRSPGVPAEPDCFAACIEGLFFFAAFAYVYFLRSRGLLNGLASGTNWVFRDESMHMRFAFSVVETVRAEHPDLFDATLEVSIREMLDDAVQAELSFARDVLSEGVAGLSIVDMEQYLKYVARRRALRTSATRAGTGPRTRSISWLFKTSKS